MTKENGSQDPMTYRSNFNKSPYVRVRPEADGCYRGWPSVARHMKGLLSGSKKQVLVVDTYQGVDLNEVADALTAALNVDHVVFSTDKFLSEDLIRHLTQPDVTDHRIFGFMTRLTMPGFFDQKLLDATRQWVDEQEEGLIMIIGPGAALLSDHIDLLVYADMPRWELQLRMRRGEVDNLGIHNRGERHESQYKRGYFVDWRVLDRHKKAFMDRWDLVLDTCHPQDPLMISGDMLREGLLRASQQPFSVVPYFDAGPWGGQWMKKVCGLDDEAENYAWCFNGVPEENSLLLAFGDLHFETPSVNVVYYAPENLLGTPVHARFGDEFPIRFDFLDTMDGGNLSLQVHPTTEYIREHFGLCYTQDESYYLMDAADDASVYLGLKEGVDGTRMVDDLRLSEEKGVPFNDQAYVEQWPARKHDHFLIPAGTVHCSGRNGMVLEISATPYIFTFKLYDWGRLGMDGRPRPINIDHGSRVIQWDRTTGWTKEQLINRITPLASGDGWHSERTGLHEREFIETQRHWFTGPVVHDEHVSVRVFNVVEGREVLVESITGAFEPQVFHYAETFIVPPAAGAIRISPCGEAEGTRCATIVAFVRT